MSAKCGGCGSDVNGKKRCSRCKHVMYCSRECQASHWKVHKTECKRLKERFGDADVEYSCARCNSKSEVRYITYGAPLPAYPPWVNQKICGKCCSCLGINPPQYGLEWVYQNVEVIKRNPRHNPFEGICAQCKKGGCEYKCPDCDCVLYCNQDCREAHRPRHENKCLLLQKKQTAQT